MKGKVTRPLKLLPFLYVDEQLQAPPITEGCCAQVAIATKDAITKDENRNEEVQSRGDVMLTEDRLSHGATPTPGGPRPLLQRDCSDPFSSTKKPSFKIDPQNKFDRFFFKKKNSQNLRH